MRRRAVEDEEPDQAVLTASQTRSRDDMNEIEFPCQFWQMMVFTMITVLPEDESVNSLHFIKSVI
jgi:hypothetical protein